MAWSMCVLQLKSPGKRINGNHLEGNEWRDHCPATITPLCSLADWSVWGNLELYFYIVLLYFMQMFGYLEFHLITACGQHREPLSHLSQCVAGTAADAVRSGLGDALG